MKRNILKERNGVALLLTLTITSLIIAVSLEVNRKVRSAVVTTSIKRDRLALSQMAAAGIHAGMAMLVRDRIESDVDSLQEDWANPEKIDSLLADTPFESGKIKVKIEDESGKIQINALVSGPGGRMYQESQRNLWERFLNAYTRKHEDFEDIEGLTIVAAMKDWLDSGDDDAITGLNGAESDYYEDLDPPHFCKNGPVNHKFELFRIKGIRPELYFGIDDVPGISEFVSVYGMSSEKTGSNLQWDGKININTALMPVIAALLPPEAEDLAEAIVEYRQEMDGESYIHDLTQPNWYKSVPGLSDVEIDADLLTVSSDTFRITATASLHDLNFTAVAVVYREQVKKTGKWTCRVLSWQSEGNRL